MASRDEGPLIPGHEDEEDEEEMHDYIDFTNNRVSVSFGVTLNTGNYSAVKMQIGQESDVPDGVDLSQVRGMMMHQLQAEMEEFSLPIARKTRERKGR